MKKIVLASSSPRRRELLSEFNLDLNIISSNIKEKINITEKPEQVAMTLAFEKAYDVAIKISEEKIVLAADTIVVKDFILGKPKSELEAFEMLSKLNGQQHYVITGISLINLSKGIKVVDYAKTIVTFKQLPESKIRKYINTGEYKDKSGGYGIQGKGSILVDEIEGSYSNVVGLPLSKVEDLLERYFGFSLL
ncbi:Maf family protein [Dethiothermospora halolimnae]|uniref:Maf family protein n=1 Tax=Dethiothermospora halolimnae TaxID=3114390 RepID=UPI003CCBF496